jgi:hypothetical protein
MAHYGTDGIKALLKPINETVLAILPVFKDGKIGPDDLLKVIEAVKANPTLLADFAAAYKQLSEAKNELKDLSIFEIIDICLYEYGFVKQLIAIIK